MAVAIETRSTWGDLVKGVSAKFAQVFNESKNSYSLALDDMVGTAGNKQTALFKQTTTDQARERTVLKTGINYLVNTAEGADFFQDSRTPGYTTTWIPQKYSQSVALSLEMLQDGDYQDQMDAFADLTVAGQETKDRKTIQLFNYAFTAQASVPADYAQYGDAKPLCSTVHPRKDGGGNLSNASSTSIPFSEANLETARLALMAQQDDRGKPMKVGVGKLILLVPPALEKSAVIVTKGETRSGTANRDINIYDGLFTVISSQYLSAAQGGSDTAWFLIDPRMAKLMFMLRKDLSMIRNVDDRSQTTTFAVYGRWVAGYADYRGIWGSQGNGAAYSS